MLLRGAARERKTANKRMSRKLFVGGLSWNTTDEGLRGAFARFGKVIEAKVVTDRETGRSRGFGFVAFDNPADSEAARQAMDGATLDSRAIRVSVAEDKPRGPRPPGDRNGPPDRPQGPRDRADGPRNAGPPGERPAGDSRPPPRNFEPRPGGFDRGPGGPPRGAPPPPPPPTGDRFEGRGRKERDRDRDRSRDELDARDKAKRQRGRGRRRHEDGDGDLDVDY